MGNSMIFGVFQQIHLEMFMWQITEITEYKNLTLMVILFRNGAVKGDGQFIEINKLALDSEGNVYATDSNLHRVQKFSESAGKGFEGGGSTDS